MWKARPTPDPVGPDQESVWDYPRPAVAECSGATVEVVFGGRLIARTVRAVRTLETSHPPTWYLPPEDIEPGVLQLVPERRSLCEWKGQARYFDVVPGGPGPGERRAPGAAWSYPAPTDAFRALAGHVAFYAAAMDECRIDGEVVVPQPGEFYGGWITSKVVGPFKGVPGSRLW